MPTIAQRRLYAAALIALPVLSVLEERLTYVAQGGAHQPTADVGTAQMLAPITAHHGLWLAGAFIAILFAVMQLPAVLAMIQLTRARTGRLTAVGGVLSLAGVAIYSGYVVTWNFIIGAMASSDAASTELAKLADDTEHYPPFLLIFANAYPMNLGLLLLAIALGRARVVPWWAAICVAVSPVNELVGSGSGWIYIIVNLVWLVGLIRVAIAGLRPGVDTANSPAAAAATRTAVASAGAASPPATPHAASSFG